MRARPTRSAAAGTRVRRASVRPSRRQVLGHPEHLSGLLRKLPGKLGHLAETHDVGKAVVHAHRVAPLLRALDAQIAQIGGDGTLFQLNSCP